MNSRAEIWTPICLMPRLYSEPLLLVQKRKYSKDSLTIVFRELLLSLRTQTFHLVDWLQMLRLLQGKMEPWWLTREDALPACQCRTSVGACVGGRSSIVFLKRLPRVVFLLLLCLLVTCVSLLHSASTWLPLKLAPCFDSHRILFLLWEES